MMTFLSYLLAFLLIVDCLLLSLLVMVQLPKKEAGAGMAFGGGAADALFGAGSGTALTKLTKYCSIIFFVLVIMLSFLNGGAKPSSDQEFKKAYESTATEPRPAPAPTATTPAATSAAPPVLLTSTNNAALAPTAPATTNPAAPAK
jgi:protein translocase SecG subunit